MLAGFDENGDPILHDPGSRNGYKRQYNKTDISKSWFDKGGISYTFYLEDDNLANENFDDNFNDVEVYPNPASDYFTIVTNEKIEFSLINNLGQVIISKPLSGKSKVDISNLNSGIYFIQLIDKNGNNNTRKFLIK